VISSRFHDPCVLLRWRSSIRSSRRRGVD
jgi:hypothetical protein